MKGEATPAAGNEESLKHSVEHVKDAAETLLRTTLDETGAKWRRARDTLGRKRRALKSRMSGRADDFALDARELASRGRHLVRRHPWASIGVGAALGLLVGLLIRRR